jgi:tRNA A37 N6-isopentenylltransferase MiaA
MKHSAYIITGPTASGKSSFAHRLACEIGGVIINCDSVQIYQGIENISASPFAGRKLSDNIDGVPYRLFSVHKMEQKGGREYESGRSVANFTPQDTGENK